MKLYELLGAYPSEWNGTDPEAQIRSLEFDSREAREGSLFFCLPGARGRA